MHAYPIVPVEVKQIQENTRMITSEELLLTEKTTRGVSSPTRREVQFGKEQTARFSKELFGNENGDYQILPQPSTN